MDNKERIMQCAEELFYAKGYDATGVQEIVEHAGVTKPTLYYYFGSKTGLLKAIFDTKFEHLMPELRKVEEQQGDIRAELYALADLYHRFFREEYQFFMLMMALYYSARENEAYQTAQPYFISFYGIVIHLFEEKAAELGNMNGRQEMFAINFIGVMNQYLTSRFDAESGTGAETESEIRAVVDQFMYGIFS